MPSPSPSEPVRALPRVFSRRRRRLLVQLVLIGFGQAAVAVTSVLLVRHVFDLFHVARGAIPGSALSLAAALVGVALVGAWLHALERVRAEMLGQHYVLEVRGVLFAHLTRIAPRVLRARNPGGMLLRFLGDLIPLRQWVSLGIARIVVASILFPAVTVALAFLSWRLAALLCLTLAAGTLLSLREGRALREATRETRRRRSHLATNVSEKLAAMSVVQVHGQERRERLRLARQGRRLFGAAVGQARASARLRAILHGTTGLVTVGVLVLGVHEVALGRTTPGVVVAALTLVNVLLPVVRDLARVHEYWHGARVSMEKMEDFLGLNALHRSGGKRRRAVERRGELAFEDVHVAGALTGVDAVAEAGSVTLVVGPNASGKSTLLALAARLIEPDRGRVLLDGRNLARLRVPLLRRALGMAGPDLPLLRGTILRNLKYRWNDAPDEEVARVCALCGVDEVLADLPAGMQTRIREGGSGLSVGQRQRICLARAVLGSPDVLLLDEVDANLDAGSRQALERVLAEYAGTVLIATHDLEFARFADSVWRLADGRLEEERTALGVTEGRT